MFLKVTGLSMTFDKKVLYDNASFSINRGEKVGIVGANGTGKTTLINILNGNLIPDQGEIEFDKKIKVGFLDQYLKVDKSKSIKDYLSEAFKELNAVNEEAIRIQDKISNTTNPNQLDSLINYLSLLQERLEVGEFFAIDSKIMRVASGLGITNYGMTTPMGQLSGGQKIKVILAKLLLEGPNLLVLDEPTNFLDTSHVDWLVKYLKEYKGTVLMVSHNQEFLNEVANYILDIEFQKITKYRGNYEAFLFKKEQALINYEKQVKANLKERAVLQDYIDKNRARASTAKRAQSRQKKLDKMEKMSHESAVHRKMYLSFNYQSISSHKFLEVTDLEIGYYYSLLPPISFTIKSGEKLALTGFNGIGKTTLLKTLVGELKPIKGRFKFVDDAKIAYFAQEHEWAHPNETPYQIISNLYPEKEMKWIRNELAKVALVGEQTMQPVSTLSGGEQSKLKLAIVMLQKANILILDEPTNHLDKEAKESLLEALKKYPGTVIFVCHERSFLTELATTIYDFEKLLV